MKVHSMFSRSLRIVIIVVGVVVVLAGLMGRAIEYEYSGPEGAADEIGVLEDGSWAAFQIVDPGSSYEIGSIDESTFVVFEIPDESDARVEVFRGTEEEAHEFMVSSARIIVFDGTRSEVIAWQEAEREGARDMLTPNLTIVVGVLVIAWGIVGGWARKNDESDLESVEQTGSLLM